MAFNFRKMLVDIGDDLSPKDLKAMKYLCRDFIPRGRLEDIDDPQDLWDALEERDKLSPNNIKFLKELVHGGCAGRVDLLHFLTKYEEDCKPINDQLNHRNNYPKHEKQCTDLSAEMQFIVKNIGRDWKELARSLGISEPDLEYISDSHPRDLRERVRQCLLLWQISTYGKDSTHDLVTALKSCSRNDLAYEIQDKVRSM